MVEQWIAEHADRIAAFRAMIERAQRSPASSAMLAQIAGQARSLLGR
jgi:glutamate dehydrogenase